MSFRQLAAEQARGEQEIVASSAVPQSQPRPDERLTSLHTYASPPCAENARSCRRPVEQLVRLHGCLGKQTVPERFRPVLSALIDMIADGDVAAMRADPAIRVGFSDPLLWVRVYPGAVTSLPPEGRDLADAVRVGGQPELWSVIIPLWTEAEGRSDLSLEATIEDRPEGPVVEIGNIHVL